MGQEEEIQPACVAIGAVTQGAVLCNPGNMSQFMENNQILDCNYRKDSL